MMQKKFSIKRLEQVRDIYVFSCFTGLAYVDVRNLRAKDITTSFDDKLWIIKKRQKTNVQSNILLLDIPKMILKKYSNKITGGKLLPLITNQRINSDLKEIADVCGIEKILTFHLARHTFATTVTGERSSNGNRKQNVGSYEYSNYSDLRKKLLIAKLEMICRSFQRNFKAWIKCCLFRLNFVYLHKIQLLRLSWHATFQIILFYDF